MLAEVPEVVGSGRFRRVPARVGVGSGGKVQVLRVATLTGAAM